MAEKSFGVVNAKPYYAEHGRHRSYRSILHITNSAKFGFACGLSAYTLRP
jgi:hypothetical protein